MTEILADRHYSVFSTSAPDTTADAGAQDEEAID